VAAGTGSSSAPESSAVPHGTAQIEEYYTRGSYRR